MQRFLYDTMGVPSLEEKIDRKDPQQNGESEFLKGEHMGDFSCSHFSFQRYIQQSQSYSHSAMLGRNFNYNVTAGWILKYTTGTEVQRPSLQLANWGLFRYQEIFMARF